MDFKAVTAFHTIVKYGSFNRAAEEMNYAQSTVTMQIQKLERELGVQLFERGKSVRLTEAGRIFLEQSRDIMQRVGQLEVNLADLKHGHAGSVRIGVTEPTASYRLPGLLKQFMGEFPKVSVSVSIAGTPVLTGQVQTGDIDFAVCSVPHAAPNLFFEPLFNEAFVLLIPAGHPLAERTEVSLFDLQEHRLLITSPVCPYRQKLEILLRESGVTVLHTMEVGSMSALSSYAACGLGIAFVPRIMVEPCPDGTIIRPVSIAQVDMLSGLLSRPDHALPVAAGKLYRRLKQELARCAEERDHVREA